MSFVDDNQLPSQPNGYSNNNKLLDESRPGHSNDLISKKPSKSSSKQKAMEHMITRTHDYHHFPPEPAVTAMQMNGAGRWQAAILFDAHARTSTNHSFRQIINSLARDAQNELNAPEVTHSLVRRSMFAEILRYQGFTDEGLQLQLHFVRQRIGDNYQGQGLYRRRAKQKLERDSGAEIKRKEVKEEEHGSNIWGDDHINST